LKQIKIDEEIIETTLQKIKEHQQNALEQNQPEINRLQAALNEAQKEKEKVFNILLTGGLSEEIKKNGKSKNRSSINRNKFHSRSAIYYSNRKWTRFRRLQICY
jgi:SOS response regulatory protein OraA/RecX